MSTTLEGDDPWSSDDADQPAKPTAKKTIGRPGRGIGKRFTMAIHGILLPAVLLGMSLAGQIPMPDQPWQSGELKDYVAMLVRFNSWYAFAPGILFSMLSLGTWVVKPKYERKLWVRLGIYTGMVLSLHFLVVLIMLFPGPVPLAGVIVYPSWLFIFWLFKYFMRRQISIWHIMVFTTLIALVMVFAGRAGTNVVFLPLSLIPLLLVATPVLNAIAYGLATISVFRFDALYATSAQSRWLIGGLISWIVLWLGAWRLAIEGMLAEYAKLPTANPNCYLSSAASFAHPILTGAPHRGAVTLGMQRLKFLELAFKALWPNVHRRLRATYDCYGPRLACLCKRWHLTASITCVALKPLELCAEFLRIILSIPRSEIEQIYHLASANPWADRTQVRKTGQ